VPTIFSITYDPSHFQRGNRWEQLAFPTLQEARKFIDLSGLEQRTTLRHPPSRSTCDAGTCVGGGVGAGVAGSSVADGAPDRRDPHALGVSLDYISTKNVTLDAFGVEFRILNKGLVPIEVPIFPNLSDLQPPDATKPFNYLSLAVVVELEKGPEQATGWLGWVELYGAMDYDGTILTLRPGQWVRVKSKMKLSGWPPKPLLGCLRGDFWLRTNVFTPREGGGFTEMTNLYPNHTVFPPIEIRFTPTSSNQSH
jgi:hypothetical protein